LEENVFLNYRICPQLDFSYSRLSTGESKGADGTPQHPPDLGFFPAPPAGIMGGGAARLELWTAAPEKKAEI